jgi:hypothetical protein
LERIGAESVLKKGQGVAKWVSRQSLKRLRGNSSTPVLAIREWHAVYVPSATFIRALVVASLAILVEVE